jgi:predicted ATP-grasp superfamily ATP-dependent carboligase
MPDPIRWFFMSPGSPPVLIFGTSVRAAAFSALRAGLSPWCADLFADVDLRRRCPAVRLAGRYPLGFLDLVSQEVPGPWMYTGGLENHALLVGQMQSRRRLWGNGPAALMRARDPEVLAGASRAAGLSCPALAVSGLVGASGAWLHKPRAGAGGAGIRHARPGETIPAGWYAQEFVAGTPAAALFAAVAGRSIFLGLTRQLVGEAWLNAPQFRYCGSIGVIDPSPALAERLRHLGALLTHRAGLMGLFGVDGLLDGDTFRPVEVNPRYTASVEVVELSTGIAALDLHARAFGEVPGPLPRPTTRRVVGKAVVYSPGRGVFPESGPWLEEPGGEIPDYADIPAPGEPLSPGHPILTVFASASTPEECEGRLRERAADVTRRLYPDLVRGQT